MCDVRDSVQACTLTLRSPKLAACINALAPTAAVTSSCPETDYTCFLMAQHEKVRIRLAQTHMLATYP